jgi:hypothetical protein
MNKQFDFTIKKFSELLNGFINNGYTFQSLEDFINRPAEKVVILRHDVDKAPLLSLQTAKLENSKGIKGSYYFRSVSQSNDPAIIKKIAALGHEIGYHYEDVARCAVRGMRYEEEAIVKLAIESFRENLDQLRKIVPIKTICMHGSPMSRWDSRILWKYYNYHDFGIIGEPYFDIDFDKVLYLTDTGRKWNGDKSSVRDKVVQEKFLALKQRLRTTDNILAALSAKEMPSQIMMTVHPQRWSESLFSWLWQYGTQTLKNIIKRLIFVK